MEINQEIIVKEIYKRAHNIQLYSSMAKMSLVRNDQQGFLDFIDKIRNEANEVYILGRHDPEKGIKLYTTAIISVTALLEKKMMRAEAVEYALSALPKFIDLHKTYCNLDSDNINSEALLSNTAALLCTMVMNICFLIVFEPNKQTFSEDCFEEYYALFQLCIKRFRMLKILYPDSPVILSYAEVIKRIEKVENPSEYQTADFNDIEKMASALSQSLSKRPLYNSEEEAYSRLSRFDKIYAEEYFDRIHDIYIKKNADQTIHLFTEQYSRFIKIEEIAGHVGKCNLYRTDDFDWGQYPEYVYTCYIQVCDKYRIKPMTFHEYRISEKVPYISYTILNRMKRDVVKTFLHLKECHIGGLGTLNTVPTFEELLDFCDNHQLERSIMEYLLSYLTFMNETDMMLIEFEEISTISLMQTYTAISQNGNDEEWRRKLKEKFIHYTYRLKGLGILDKDWEFSIY